MKVLSGLIGMVGIASLLYALTLLNQLSRKLGAVTKMPPFYRGYYVAIALAALAFLARLVHISGLGNLEQPEIAWLGSTGFAILVYHVPLALAVTISLFVTWRYWSWLLRE